MTTDSNSLVPQNEGDQAVSLSSSMLSGLGVDLGALQKRMAALESAGDNASTGSYNTRGMVKIELSKDGGGRFSFTNPYTGDIQVAKQLMCTVRVMQFTGERWVGQNEPPIPGLDMKAYEKKPICRVAHYNDPESPDPANPIQSKDGYFEKPAMSMYHMNRFITGAVGTNGPDGKTPGQPCATCPLAQKPVLPLAHRIEMLKPGEEAKAEKLCKPSGIVELVIFGADNKIFAAPIYGFLRLSLTSIVKLVDDLKVAEGKYKATLTKMFGGFLTQLLTWRLDASVESGEGGIRWAVVNFDALGYVDNDTVAAMTEAIDKTRELMSKAEEANKQQAKSAPTSAAFGGGNTPPVTPPTGDKPPF